MAQACAGVYRHRQGRVQEGVRAQLRVHRHDAGMPCRHVQAQMRAQDSCEGGVLYHPSSGQVFITFGQEFSHLDNDVTQYMYMWHSPLQYMASLVLHITFA